jgi:hypothetical protein
MKKFLSFIALAAGCCFFVTSCTKVEPNPTSGNTMQAVVGGAHYADSIKYVATGTSVSASKVGTFLNVEGVFSSFSLYLNINYYQGFQLTVPVDGVQAYATKVVGTYTFTATSGSITITNTYPTLIGNYNLQFLATTGDSTVISHGTFSCVSPNP